MLNPIPPGSEIPYVTDSVTYSRTPCLHTSVRRNRGIEIKVCIKLLVKLRL